MKKAPLLAFPLVACGLSLLVLSACPQQQTTSRISSGGGDGDTLPNQVSPCLSEATIQLSANPTRVTFGQSSTVSWSVELPNNCPNVKVKFEAQAVGRSGSQSVTPSFSSLFRLTISETHLGVFGQTSQTVEIGVDYPPRVVIDSRTPNPGLALIGALQSANPQQTVEFCGDLDLTRRASIVIGDNRELIASASCVRGPRSFGPRIFVTDKRDNDPLFVIEGDNVRFSGFRLEGPTKDSAQGDVTEVGIMISPASNARPISKIEISNTEIFHWSGAGVSVKDNVKLPPTEDPNDTEIVERGRLFNTNPGAVSVKGNFIHHNRHGAGFGYGVVSGAGAYLTIEQNVFDENRHAIAGESRHADALDFSGYTARENLILSDGGQHCRDGGTGGAIVGGILGGLFGGVPGVIAGAILGGSDDIICWQTHQIDMHGDSQEWYGSHNFACGIAGETLLIERNTILYDNGYAIKIRGTPADKAVLDGNVFTHDSLSDAMAVNGACRGFVNSFLDLFTAIYTVISTTHFDIRPNNVFGFNPMAKLGSGDFFGDGQMEQFMATGVTWWAKSPVTGQWRYLNTMKERLPDLVLVDVDGDGICDVAMRPPRPEMAPTKYSKSGTGPWKERDMEKPQGPTLEQ